MKDTGLLQDLSRPPGRELGYAAERSGARGRLMRAIERLSGLKRIRPQYEIWRRDVAGINPRMFNVGLDMLGTRLNISARQWPAAIAPDAPLAIICNHPFGIGDGIAALALAEDLGRPFKVLVNKEFLRVPEVQPFALPIDFDETREAVATNLTTRIEARKLMQQGVTMIAFPAGSVATARFPWGRAQELPWKLFVARLVQESQASVLPVWFEGQNSAFFQTASRFAPSLRMSLLVAEFRRFAGREISLRIGTVTPFEDLRHGDDRKRLLEELFIMVHRLAPHLSDVPDDVLKAQARGPSPSFDRPVARRRGR